MLLENIGEIMVRGYKGLGRKVQGQVAMLLSPEDRDPETLRNRLVVISHCDHTFLQTLKYAAGIILQNFIGDSESEAYAETLAKSFGISMICRADGAMAVLREGETVTLDPQRGLIYCGTEELSISRAIGPRGI
jgi:pyruvate kinase